MNHWKKGLFTAAALIAALPIAYGQSAPVATPAGAWRAEATKASDSAPADRAYLGVYPSSDSEGGGVKLEQVLDGSPAAKAGLQSGDVITALGDRTVGSDEELRSAIASHQSGEKVKITFLRDGEKRRTSARLGKAPSENDAGGGEAPAVAERAAEKSEKVAAEKAAKSAAKGGGMVEVAPFKDGDEDAGYMGVTLSPASDGRTSVASVVDGAPAQKAGFQVGDVILKVDGEEASSSEELVGLVKKHHPGDRITVAIERDGKPQKLKVKLASRNAANLGGGASVGGMAAPVPDVPETKSVESAAPRAARARTRSDKAPAADAAGSDAMRKEVDGMRAELDHLRRSMEELQKKCESQQRTIEKIRRALDGNDEPGSFSYGGNVTTVPAVSATAAVATVPSELLATTSAAAVAAPDGGGTFEVVSGDGAVNVPVILQIDGSDQKIELENLGTQIQALVGQHHGDGQVIHLKPQVDGQAIQFVIDGEGGESCCAEGQSKEESGEKNVIVLRGANAKNVKVMKAVAGKQGTGAVLDLQPMVGQSVMKVAPTVRTVVVRGGQGEAAEGAHAGCGCCSCGSGGMAGHPGMGMGGMPGMGGNAGTFVMPVPPQGGGQPMRARMHPGFPGMPGAPAAPRGGMKFEMKGPGPQSFPQMAGGGTMVWKCEGPCELTFGPQGAQFRCEGSCEISQATDTTDVAGTFAMKDAGSDDFGENAGSNVFMFSGDESGEEHEDADDDCCAGSGDGCCEGSGDECCEKSGGGDDCQEQSGSDDQDEGQNGDDEDDDDGDASVAVPASIAYPAI